ncbi:hypothetical protein L1987_57342 [Smallanthus sonchifolius]|uniref:Uncharacterized protein n=1 Tax=Smallanthus sonchifolius TaxID=185202 RepID=A0ACB9DCV1_9ASTR|nr:hypothetical protein L1987_57342 [Smallanthus sonchifolius]
MANTATVLTAEDIYYMRKIEQLANESLKFFCDKELREEQAKEITNSKAMSKRARPMSSAGEDDIHKKRKVPKKAVRTPVVINEVTERLKEFIGNEMKGTEMKLVIQKVMYKSDTEKGLNRLNMPIKQLESDEFLTAEERHILNKRNPKENEIEVPLLGPTLEMHGEQMKLKMWHMASTVTYVLTTGWFRFWKVNKPHLLENSKIQVWSFRRDGQLCFAVACVGKPE